MPPGLAWWPVEGIKFVGLLSPFWWSLQVPYERVVLRA
jgi:hypothetical protein